VSVLLAARADSFEAPGVGDFWQPLIGEGSFALTRPSVVLALSVVLIIAFFVTVSRKMAVVPSKSQFLAESVYGLVRNSVAREVIGSHDFLKFVPFLFSMFTLLLVNNLFGVLPFVQFPTMSRIAFPIALTIIVYIVYQTVAFRKKGFFGYLKSLVPPGLPGWMIGPMWVLEFLTYFINRPVTLALRLFGNMFAGHLLLLVFTFGGEYLLLHTAGPTKVAGVLSLLFTIVMSFFEVLVEFLQAYIFTMLAALYIAGAVADEH
jgi:F-type H+-transporting ATPase subunit a